MKILVIDDCDRHADAALTTLAGHDVIVKRTVKDAYEFLNGEDSLDLDAVLTDLFMPVGDFTGAMDYRSYPVTRNELPVGLVFAIKASNRGIRTVIVTDANHHNDWIVAVMDLLSTYWVNPEDPVMSRGIEEDSRRIANVEMRMACLSSDSKTKDWLKAMRSSDLFPELDF